MAENNWNFNEIKSICFDSDTDDADAGAAAAAAAAAASAAASVFTNACAVVASEAAVAAPAAVPATAPVSEDNFFWTLNVYFSPTSFAVGFLTFTKELVVVGCWRRSQKVLGTGVPGSRP